MEGLKYKYLYCHPDIPSTLKNIIFYHRNPLSDADGIILRQRFGSLTHCRFILFINCIFFILFDCQSGSKQNFRKQILICQSLRYSFYLKSINILINIEFHFLIFYVISSYVLTMIHIIFLEELCNDCQDCFVSIPR